MYILQQLINKICHSKCCQGLKKYTYSSIIKTNGLLPKTSITHPTINLVIRTITNRCRIQWLTTKATSETMPVIISRGCHHFFGSKNLYKAKQILGDKNKQNLDDKSKQIVTLPEHLGQRVLSPSSPIIEVVSNGMDFVVALCPWVTLQFNLKNK